MDEVTTTDIQKKSSTKLIKSKSKKLCKEGTNAYYEYERYDCLQKFYGLINHNCMHGDGIYTQRKPGNNFVYDGLLYMNQFEGYGRLIFGNCSKFNGLFKNNKRFGPGLLTYCDGSQDIGLWNGVDLMRLAIRIGKDNVPQLAKSPAAKRAILQFRKLVPLSKPPDNYILYNSQIRTPQSYFFDNLYHDQILFECFDNTIKVRKDKGTNTLAETNGSSSSIDTIRNNILELAITDIITEIKSIEPTNLDDILLLREKFKSINSNLKSNDSEEKQNIIDVNITHLLPWNNEDYNIAVMKHAFTHRNHESKCNIDLKSILKGKRNNFAAAGLYELACQTFLEACFAGHLEEVLILLKFFNINPDVTDANGNSGVILAASSDQILIIKALVNAGAKLDLMNDEGLTALNICLLRCIALKYDISNWESAFLDLQNYNTNSDETDKSISPKFAITFQGQNKESTNNKHMEELKKLLECHYDKFGMEKEVLTHNLESDGIIISDERPSVCHYDYSVDTIQNYIFDLDIGISTQIQQNTTDINETSRSADLIENLKFFKLFIIENTIKLLLQLGVNPLTTEVPICAMILTLYLDCPEILDRMLKATLNFTKFPKYGDNQLNFLHILCSLPPSPNMHELWKLLLDNKYDPHERCHPDHWIAAREIILGDILDEDMSIEDLGKTPLHILATRLDYGIDSKGCLNKLAEVLVEYSPNTVRDLYLGHTPLSLAVLRGNINLVETLLKMNGGPNKNLSYGLGNTLTLYCLKRYKDIIPNLETCKKILDLLYSYNANPLINVDNAENAIEFLEHSNEELLIDENIKPTGKGKHSPKTKIDSSLIQKELYEHLKHMARTTFWRHTQLKIFSFLCEKVIHEKLLNYQNYAMFFTMDEMIKLITLLHKYGTIDLGNDVQYVMCYMMLEFVKEFGFDSKIEHTISKNAGTQTNKGDKKQKKGKRDSNESQTNATFKTPYNKSLDILLEILTNAGKYKSKVEDKLESIPFEFDPREEIYKICYHCCQRSDKLLILCNVCGLVYYCSQNCNDADNKSNDSRHICKIPFYDNSLFGMLHMPSIIETLNEISLPHPNDIIKNSSFQLTLFALTQPKLFQKTYKNMNVSKGKSREILNLDVEKGTMINTLRNVHRASDPSKPRRNSKSKRVSVPQITNEAVINTFRREERKPRAFVPRRRETWSSTTSGGNESVKNKFTKLRKPKVSFADLQTRHNLKQIYESKKFNPTSTAKFNIIPSQPTIFSQVSNYKRLRFIDSKAEGIKTNVSFFPGQKEGLISSHSMVTTRRNTSTRFTELKFGKFNFKTKSQLTLRMELEKEKDKEESKKAKESGIPRISPEFLNTLAEFFPDFDFTQVLAPFVGYSDSQFYYKFSPTKPEYISSHM